MNSTNTNSVVLSPADLALIEQLFSHMQSGVVSSHDPSSNPQPSQPIFAHSLHLPSAQLSQPTLQYSAPITQATTTLGPVPSIQPLLLTQVTAAPPQSSQPMSDVITELYLTS